MGREKKDTVSKTTLLDRAPQVWRHTSYAPCPTDEPFYVHEMRPVVQ